MTDRELMQDALDALTYVGDKEIYSDTIDALRARLTQPEPAECDGGQCGIGGYCKQCPKTQLEPKPDYEAEFIKDWNEGKVRRVSDGKRMVPETAFGKMPETINMENFVGSGKPLVPVCWMNANDIDKTDWKVWAHGKPTVSMPLFTVPPQREWVGLTREELEEISEFHFHGAFSGRDVYEDIETRLKEKNT